MAKDNQLALPDKFRESALAYPTRVQQIIAKIDNPTDAQKGIAEADALLDWAKRLKADTEAINYLQYGRLLFIAKLGSMLPRHQGKKLPTSSVGGFQPNTLSKYRKVADHADQIDAMWDEIDRSEYELSIKSFLDYIGSGGVIATRHGGGVVEWYTPEEYIEKSRRAMGGIDLDPASCKSAQAIVKADRYFTLLDDGLAQVWDGKVFLNPPFKMPDVAKFVNKLCDSFEDKITTQAVLLTNNNTDTDWWQRAASMASVVCLTDGRIGFYNDAGETSQPTNGQSFCYLGDRKSHFIHEFLDIGLCMEIAKSDTQSK